MSEAKTPEQLLEIHNQMFLSPQDFSYRWGLGYEELAKICAMLVEFQQAVKVIAESFQQELINQVGTDNGQLLAPLQNQINLTSAILTEKLNSVSTLLTLEIDPAKETSVVGRFLSSLRQLLDAKRSDSIQGAFKAALINATKENGTLPAAVKNVVSESVKPLTEQVEKLTREIRDQQVTQQVLEQTTAKGINYEELVVVELRNWSKLSGVEVEHIGHDGDTGDTALAAIMQYSFSPCPLLSKLSDLRMYLIAAVSAVFS